MAQSSSNPCSIALYRADRHLEIVPSRIIAEGIAVPGHLIRGPFVPIPDHRPSIIATILKLMRRMRAGRPHLILRARSTLATLARLPIRELSLPKVSA